jgi:hypothetical protein
MKKRSSSQKSQKRTVKTKTQERVTIGMDLGDKTSRYCLLRRTGTFGWTNV